jgi:phage-related protein
VTPRGGRGRRGGRESSSRLTPAQSESAAAGAPEWHWWGSSLTGRRRAEEEMDRLPVAERAALAAVITRIIAGTTRGGDVKPLAPGILEGRVQVNGAWPRVAYSHLADGFVGLTVFRKKKNETEQDDVDRAKARLRSWRKLTGS